MTKPAFWQLAPRDQRALFAEAGEHLHLPAHMVEKDAWVCWTIQGLFALPDARDHFIFKGGTSLSKVWKVIHRFSEDIDISLSREWLGFTGARDPEGAPSRKKRTRLLEELSAACADKLRDEVAPALRRMTAQSLASRDWSLDVAPEDAQTLLFSYPSVFQENTVGGYVRPVIRIECGARSDRWPVADRQLSPCVAEAFPEAFPNAAFTIPVLGIERTFWEKATILHAEAHRPSDREIPARFSRHYSDLAALAKHPAGRQALDRDELRRRVVEHKQVFFAASWAHYETAVPGQFRLVPSSTRLQVLERDYQAMQDMFFQPPAPWGNVVTTLARLEKTINGKPA